MSVIRPEIRAAILRGREALAGATVTALGLWMILSGYGITIWVGAVLALAGVALIVSGVQRWRFRGGSDGPGVVRVTEGQITYYGPLEGGSVALDLLDEITLDPRGKPLHWVLRHGGGAPLHIPVTAAGAETLFDVFAALPGLRTQTVLAALETPGDLPHVIWTRRRATPRLG